MNKQCYYKITNQLYTELIELVDSNEIIRAIKHLRSNGADSLKEAKRIIDMIRYCRETIFVIDNYVLIPETNIFSNVTKS